MALTDPAEARTPTEVNELTLNLTVTVQDDGTRSYAADYSFVYSDADGPILETRRSGDALPHLSTTAKQGGKTVIDEALDIAQGTLP